MSMNVSASYSNTSESADDKFNGTLTMKSEIVQLDELGIMSGVGYGPHQNITRAEMAKIVIQLLALPESYDTCDFIDVSAHNPYAPAIEYVSELGIMTGAGNGLFLPDKDISYFETMKTIITLLGYEPIALEKGGYPHGYLTVSAMLDLILFPSGADSILTKEKIAKILLKAIDVPIMVQTGFGASVEYTVMDGKDGVDFRTLRSDLNEILSISSDASEVKSESDASEAESESDVPLFNGEEYSSRTLQITGLKKTDDGYSFENSLDAKDNSVYVINADTYVYVSDNTVDLTEIKNEMYALCWHYTDDDETKEILKIELMKNKPSGI